MEMEMIQDLDLVGVVDSVDSQPTPSTSRPVPSVTVIVDDAHPFDLDAYIASYSGMTSIMH